MVEEKEVLPEETVDGSMKLLNDPETVARLSAKSLEFWGTKSRWKNVFKKGQKKIQGRISGTNVMQSRVVPYTIAEFEKELDEAIDKRRELLNESYETERAASEARESGKLQDGVETGVRQD
jgi:hypothetical protein